MPEGSFATTDLAVTESGAGDELVVFVHGVLDRGRSFERVAEVLSPDCRMVLYDRRGYGGSANSAEVPVGIDRHIADLVDVLDGRPAIVVGHSFGGVTAMGAAVRAPEIVRAVVLYETSMAWVPGWDDGVMENVLASNEPEDAALRMMLGPSYDDVTDAQRARRRADARVFLAEERSVRTGTPPFDVADIRAPIVYGRSDPAVMPMVLEYLQRNVPYVEVVTLAGATHTAHRTAPDEFAALVRRGLELAGT
jgi:pimeloyl-ACP methyl ester carboxylesterase